MNGRSNVVCQNRVVVFGKWPGKACNRVAHFAGPLGGNQHFQLQPWHVELILGSPVECLAPPNPMVIPDFGDRDSSYAHLFQDVFRLLQWKVWMVASIFILSVYCLQNDVIRKDVKKS